MIHWLNICVWTDSSNDIKTGEHCKQLELWMVVINIYTGLTVIFGLL